MSKKNGHKGDRDQPMPLTFEKDRKRIDVRVKFTPEGDKWNAECLEFGTAQFGASREEAAELIVEAIALHLNALEDVGELERFCAEHGIEIYEETGWSLAQGQRLKMAV